MSKMKLIDVKDKVMEVDISKVIERYIRLQRKGKNYQGLCPFHNDNNIGSFIVSTDKKMFNCFSCSTGGNVINFVSKFKGISFNEATIEIALEENIIEQGDVERYFANININSKEVIKAKTVFNHCKDLNIRHEITNREKNDFIYRIFLDQLAVTENHMNYLVNVRGFTKNTIEKRLYKSYPKSGKINNIMDIIINSIAEVGMEETIADLLSNIPGFYKKKTEDYSIWDIPLNQGIIIPISDADGCIIGLQIRNDLDDYNRYKWFSSSFAIDDMRYEFGKSPGSPIDVIYPDISPTETIYITEGRFKSETICKVWNSISISVQGVGNWKGINEEILILKSKFDKDYFKTIHIAFDSDVIYKEQVFKQLKGMSNKIINDFPDIDIKYIVWNEDKGKGIDDLYRYCKKSNKDINELITVIEKNKFDDCMKEKHLQYNIFF